MNSAIFRRNFPFYLFILILVGAFIFFFVQAQGQKNVRRKAISSIPSDSRDQKLQQFNLTGFDDKGEKFWNLQGQSAKIDPGQTVYLDENVTLRLRDNTVIRTDHVQWSQDGGTMRTNSHVFVDHEALKVTGVGAVGRPADSFIQLNKNIVMTSKEGSVLTCDGPMKIFYDQDKMIFFRKVRAVDQRATLTARRMDVSFEPTEKKVKQIIAMGDVTIQRGTDTTHSQRAIYTVATGSIRLEGNPDITVHEGGAALKELGLKK